MKNNHHTELLDIAVQNITISSKAIIFPGKQPKIFEGIRVNIRLSGASEKTFSCSYSEKKDLLSSGTVTKSLTHQTLQGNVRAEGLPATVLPLDLITTGSLTD